MSSSDNGTDAARGHWLRPLRMDWPRALVRILEASTAPAVRVVVAEVKGSAPREPGACMLVSESGAEGTIGGGHLEWEAMRAAHELLADVDGPAVRVWSVILGRELSQCCGGSVQLRLERFTRADLPFLRHVSDVVAKGRPTLWLHGAGHVGQALIRVISDLPFDVTWVDSRPQLLPADLPENVHALAVSEPVSIVAAAPVNACHLIMTHDHAVDYSLCRAILERGEFGWLGLIGSNSKAAKFRSRLARDGISPEMIARLVCPIGIGRIDSKWPAAIAIAVAAQLLQVFESLAVATAATAVTAEPHPAGSLQESLCRSTDCANCASSHEHVR
ncbi:MAG: xanthine dehydrogenase accessory factor [Gammaproteobacteria bacterium]|nr:xanthine dehydrogenase accessory factor [Gammaproteobacteria bacterium]